MRRHVLIFVLMNCLILLGLNGMTWATPKNSASDGDGNVALPDTSAQHHHKHKKKPDTSQCPSLTNGKIPNNRDTSGVLPITGADTNTEPVDAKARCGYYDCLPLVPAIDDVYYTVKERGTVAEIASLWGVPAEVLVALNSGMTLETKLEPGQKLLAQARLASDPEPYSRGRTNRGRISNARLMPEGNGYFLRTRHPNSWGTDNTVRALMTMFDAYHAKYPDAPDVNFGDISRRRGGRLRPHKSHQSGRDVDFGFVHTQIKTGKHPESFTRAEEDNLDVEKTWFLAESLIRTGEVKVIYVDIRVQKMLYQYAAPKMTPEQRDLIFSVPHRETSSAAIFQHWSGHRNHFHVRFKCPKDQPICHE